MNLEHRFKVLQKRKNNDPIIWTSPYKFVRPCQTCHKNFQRDNSLFQYIALLEMANTRQIRWHLIMDIVCLVVLGIADMLFHVIPIKPSHRGFFCDDKSLQKPFQKETIPTWLTIIVGFFVTIPVVRKKA